MLRVLVLRRLENLLRFALLDDFAACHHAHAVGDLSDDTEIVGDQQHGHAALDLEVPEQRQNLRLDSDIQRRRGLICDQKLGVVGQRHRNHDALPLSARKLVRIGGQPAFRFAQPDLV